MERYKRKGKLVSFLLIMLIMTLTYSSIFANSNNISNDTGKTEVTIVDYDISLQHHGKANVLINMKDSNGTEISNFYNKDQLILSENSDVSFIRSNSNCIYLNETDYKTVVDDIEKTSVTNVIMQGLLCLVLCVIVFQILTSKD